MEVKERVSKLPYVLLAWKDASSRVRNFLPQSLQTSDLADSPEGIDGPPSWSSAADAWAACNSSRDLSWLSSSQFKACCTAPMSVPKKQRWRYPETGFHSGGTDIRPS